MKKIVLILCAMTLAHAAEEKKQPNTKQDVVHEGELFLYPLRPMFYGSGNSFCGKTLQDSGINYLKPDELCFEVWATSDECNNWQKDRTPPHAIFPEYLPFSILKDLDEGDQICLKLTGFKCCLTLKQKGKQYETQRKFQDVRDELLNVVLKQNKLDYDPTDENFLEQQGIIEPEFVPALFPKGQGDLALEKKYKCTATTKQKYKPYLTKEN
ncbi:MAG: hypothetical protein AB7R69_03065 [Candidatus Babeliales bacterium]